MSIDFRKLRVYNEFANLFEAATVAKTTRSTRRRKKQWLVFISHHGTDTWVARQIEREIKLCGADTFLDQTHISIGEDFEETILITLEKADEFVVLLTPWALSRPYVWTEVGLALGRGIPLIGILYGVRPEDPVVPEFLRRRILVDVNELVEYLNQLKTRIGLSTGA